MRLIRWTYVAPRLFALLAVCLVVHYALDPLLQTTIIRSLTDGAGVPTHVDSVSSSVLRTNVVLHDVRFGYPQDPGRELCRADRAVLDFDTGALLRKRLVVRRASIQGLQIDVPSDGWQADPESDEAEMPAWLGGVLDGASQAGTAMIENWLGSVQASIERDLRAHFATIREVEALAEKWPARLARLRNQAEQISIRGREIAAQIELASENPLRHLGELQQLSRDVDQLRRDAEVLLTEIHAVTPEWTADQQRVADSLARDKAQVERQIELGEISPEALTDYLLRDEVTGRVGTAIRWLQTARRLAFATKPPEPERCRGEVIVFAGQAQHPEYLVRSTDIEGLARMDGVPFSIRGRVDGLSSHPRLYGRPVVAKLTADGPIPFEMLANFDRTGDEPRDDFVIRCDQFQQPGRVLGEGAVAVTVEPGTAQFEGRLVVAGERLDGDFYFLQQDVRVVSAAGREQDEANGKLTVAPLVAAMESIDAIDARVTLSGTLDAPRWKLESQLGEQLATVLRETLHRELTRHRDEQLAAAEARLESKMAELTQLVTARQEELMSLIADQEATLAEHAQAAARHTGLPLQQLSRGVKRGLPVVR